MSTTQIRTDGTDNYIVLSQYDASSNLEVAIAQALVQSAFAKTTIEPNQSIYISPANDSSWNCVFMNDTNANYIETSAISNYPSGTLPEYSVISSELTTDISLNSYTTNISSNDCSNNTYTFQSLPSSASYYDSNYVFTQNLIADCADNQTGSYVNATFDIDASNAKIQYAMQSRWNTTLGPYTGLQTVGPDPTAITQYVDFNTNSALARYGSGATDASYESYWFSVDGSNGTLVPYIVDASYQPVFNNLLVRDRDITGVTLNVSDDVGIYRIQQASNTPDTTVSQDGGLFNVVNSYDLDNMPLFDGNGQSPLVFDSSKNSLPIPGNMSAMQFESLLNEDVYNTVANDWTFQIDVSTNDNSGYNIDMSHPLISDLDNSNLLDNPFYMENYVSNEHSITFSNASISIDVSANGTSTDANSITIDLSNGETLQQIYAGVDGEIIINTNTIHTRYTDLSNVDLIGNFTPLVAYPGDVVATPVLSEEEMTNPYFKGMWQKVAQQSSVTSPDYWLKTDASAIMTLYTQGSGIVDNFYNASDFDFSFNNTFGANEDIQLWQITGSNNVIVNPSSFYTDSSYTNQELGIATAGVLTGITDDISYNSYRILLDAKTKEDIGLYNAVTDVSGWTLTYTDILDNFLHSSADQAYSKSALPIYDQSVITALDTGDNLNFSYTYKTIEDSDSPGGLSDSVDISYNNHVVTIVQKHIVRNYDASYTNTSYSIVPDTSYNFTGTFLNKTSYQLVYVNANSKYNASFFANYGPFTNITLTVNDILQNDKFYTVRNISTGQLFPHSVLAFVSAPDISNLTHIDETITPSSGNSLSINGTFTANDLKPFYSVTQGENLDNTWTDIATSIDTDVYYGLENEDLFVLGTGVLTTIIQYTPFSDSVNQSINVDLDLLNYYIPFVYEASNNSFSVENFTSSPSTLAANTNIESPSFLGTTDYLTLTNGYNNVVTWNTQYTLTLSHTATSTTFTVKNSLDVTQFTITLLNNTIFLGTFFVSYIPEDYYRVERLLGEAENDNNTYIESFLSTNYGAGRVNLTPTLEGIYINNPAFPMTPTACPQLGSYQSFRVLGDYMNINEVGVTTSPTSNNELGTSYNSGSLTFQYISGSNYSASFTFPKYRGYKSYNTTNPDQYYVINRDATSVTFNVDGSGSLTALNNTLTSNMYSDELFNVNNLQDSDSRLVANLGVTGSFYYSMPPPGSTLTYPVTVTGDNVAVSITNPNYLGDASNIIVPVDATPVVDPRSYSNLPPPYATNWIATGDSKNWRSVSISSTGQYQTALVNGEFIYLSTNYGNTWTATATDASRNWTSVSISSSGQYQTAVVENGEIYVSSNYGNTWTARPAAGSRAWLSVAISSTGQYQTAGDYAVGFIYTSSDYGDTWTPRPATNTPGNTGTGNWRGISLSSSGQYQTAVSMGQYIYVSTDYGNTWIPKMTDQESFSWISVSISSTGQYQTVVAFNNKIYVSTDYGNTWASKTFGDKAWNSVSISSTGQYQTALAQGDLLYASSDYGNNWSSKPAAGIRTWRSVSISSSGQYQTAVAQGSQIYISNNPIPTLKDYGQNDMYTFSGIWYDTGRLMGIRPSRVKLNNTAYSYNTLSYKITLLASVVRLYKALNDSSAISFNWLGNPSIKGSQDGEIVPSSSDWVLKKTVNDLIAGFDIGTKNVYQDPNAIATLKIVYIISTPPYYNFEQTSTDFCPVIPYDASNQYVDNQTFISMPYISTSDGSLNNTFEPFAPSTTYTDINGNNTSVQNNVDLLNNVRFNLLTAPSITNAIIAPDSTRYGIIVPGTNLTVNLYTGLYNNTDSGNHTNPIWSGPVTSIPSTPDINNNALIFRGRDASGSISFSALQYPADIGYPSGADGYEEIFKNDISSNWYNIDFNMGNSAWFNDNAPITYFDANAHGIKPTLYTVVDINNPLNQINKRRVYKYTTPSTIDIDISGGQLSGYETFNMTFESRYYHDFDISKNNVFPDASGAIWKYNDLLNNTVIPDTNISWTLDASYSDTAYISWAFGNSITARNMLIALFGVQSDQQKWAYIQLEPFMRYLNQFNMQVGSVAWDGTVTAPLVNTRVVKLVPSLTNPTLLNNTYTTQQYSESTL
jgi:photosystem II stability/assembly factor-like uncharacterized protein